MTVGFVGNVMRLTTGDRAFDMRPVASASGAKYEAVGDPSTTLWNKGDETIIVIKGQTYPPCTQEQRHGMRRSARPATSPAGGSTSARPR